MHSHPILTSSVILYSTDMHAIKMNLFDLYHKEVKKSTVTSIVSVLQQLIDNDQLIETSIGLSLLYKL